MQTRSSSKLARDQTSNPTSSTNPTPNGRIHRSSKQKVENSHFEEHLTPVATMTDNRTMAEMLRTPTEGCAESIIVPPILAEKFKLKLSLINMMTSEQFFGLKKDNPHDHVRWFNKITSTIKYKDVPNSVIKLILFPFSLAGAARRWLEKEPSRSIITWDDLVSKFINEFFPPSRTTNLRNEISNFQQKFDESFHEAWDRYKDLLRACPHHDFTKLHQLDTFYNALNPADQDSLNAAAGGNLLEKSPQDALTIIENKSKVRNSRSKPIAFPVNACDNHSSSELAKLTHAVNQQTKIESDANFDDDSFDSEGKKIKEAELLIDQLNLPCDILSEYDSFNSQDFSRDDVLPSPDNEDKVFNPGILSHEKSVKIITRVTQEKKLAVSYASWLFEDFDPPSSIL
nr:reverse transcriptase domain-containing protein [Tanacetum cinerariifolium]